MKLEDALRKIRKCLALANDKSADANIAESAMRQAQTLMAEFSVSVDDARLSSVEQTELSTRTKSHLRWEVYLATEIADAFGCKVIWSRQRRWLSSGRAAHQTSVTFVGVGPASTIAGYAWDVLSRQCAKARLAHIRQQPGRCKPITLSARGDVFAEGWVHAATAKLQALAITDADSNAISSYMDVQYPQTTKFKPKARQKGRNVSHNDAMQGYKAGKGAQLHKGVDSAAQGLLAGGA